MWRHHQRLNSFPRLKTTKYFISKKSSSRSEIKSFIKVVSRLYRRSCALPPFFSSDINFYQLKSLCFEAVPYGPVYSWVLSCLASERKWGYSWPCFDRNLPSHVNDAVLMLISRSLLKKNSEVSIKTRALSFEGQATQYTTVKINGLFIDSFVKSFVLDSTGRPCIILLQE